MSTQKEMAPTGIVGATHKVTTDKTNFTAVMPAVQHESAQRAAVLAAATHLRVPLFRGAKAATPEPDLYDITGLWLKPSQAADPKNAKSKHDGWAITAYGELPKQRAGFKPSQMVLLNVDLDQGNLSAATVAEHVREFFGPETVACIYSTASSLPNDKRWRVVVPLSAPVGLDSWQLAMQAFAAHMRMHGVTLDASMERATQLAFTPNVPPHKRDPFTGKPLHFEHGFWGCELLDPDTLNTPSAIAAFRRVAEAEAETQAAAEAQRQQAERKAAERLAQRELALASGGDGLTPVEKFNLTTDVETLLRKYGYTEDASKPGNWRSPYQASGSFATMVRPDGSWYSFSGSDAAKGLGTPQKNGVGGDAFDLYCQFEHGGNYAVAVASVGAKQSVGNAFTGEPLPEGWGAADVLIPFGAAHGGAGAHGPKRYHLQTADEFLSKPPVRWYVRDVMPVNGVAVIYGKSGSGKTFLTLDLMLALLDDQSAEWCGDKIRERPSGVVYLAMEGAFGVRGRVKAWSQDTGRPAPANLRFLEGVPFNLAQPADVQALIDSVNEAIGGQAIVVVDTQAKASAGSDEQTAKDMGVVFAAAERIAHGINGLCITVAHAGKDETKGLRGSSAQTGAADLIMLVSREGDSRSWLIEKNKDGVDGKAGFFTLESLDIGIDEDGDAVSSAIVVHKDKLLTPTEN